MTKRNWKEAVLTDYPRLTLESKFKFACHKDLSCFTRCCRDVNIFLTPYDVLRMKRALGLSSGEFLEKYTIPLLLEDQKITVILLKMGEDKDKTCPFVAPEGCLVYNDRPWSCRMYPIGMASEAEPGRGSFFVMGEDFPCEGFQQNRKWTVGEWMADQGVETYNSKSEGYKEITSHRCFREGVGVGPSKVQMFHLACYDLDRFRRLIFESSFFNRFDLEQDFIEKLRTDDDELLEFSFRWLKFSLFGEDCIKIKGEVLEEKKRELDKTRGSP